MFTLQGVPEEEKQHFLKCSSCHKYFDCRNLSQVLVHTHQKIGWTDFISARKLPEPIVYIKGKIEIVIN